MTQTNNLAIEKRLIIENQYERQIVCYSQQVAIFSEGVGWWSEQCRKWSNEGNNYSSRKSKKHSCQVAHQEKLEAA